MDKQKRKETATHLERLQKKVWIVESSLVDHGVPLNNRVRALVKQARLHMQYAEQLVRESLKE